MRAKDHHVPRQRQVAQGISQREGKMFQPQQSLEEERQPKTGSTSTDVLYLLSADDRILWVSDNWDAFALANGGTGAVAELVIGHSLYDFVLGESTRMLYDTILHSVRLLGRPSNLDYRCDSPDLVRTMTMRCTPEPKRQVLVCNHVVHTAPKQRPVHYHYQAHSPLQRCSICCALRKNELWREEALVLGDVAALSQPVNYSVCPRCIQKL